MKKIYIEGNDLRAENLRRLYVDNICENISEAHVVFLPIPFSKDMLHVNIQEKIKIEEYIEKLQGKCVLGGPVPNKIEEIFKNFNIEYTDLFERDDLAYLNAIATAEGAIFKAIKETDFVIHGSKVCVIGFGRCGKILADKLKGMNAKVTCVARNKKDLALINALGYNSLDIKNLADELRKFDIIYTTVPTCILDSVMLKNVREDTVIIDIASMPGSVDYIEADKLHINAFLELGIPGKIAPKTSAKFLKNIIDEFLIN